MDELYNTNPEDVMIDDDLAEMNDAADDILHDDGADIDRIGDITDADVEACDEDIFADIEDYRGEDYVEPTDADVVEYEFDEGDDEDESDAIAAIQHVIDTDNDEEDL